MNPARLLRAAMLRGRLFLVRNRQFDDQWLRAHFRAAHDVEVGLHSYGCFDPWRVQGPVTIGRYCSFAKTARVVNANHPLDALTTHPMLYEKAFGVVDEDRIVPERLIVEDDVWVGHHAILLPGCRFVGRGAVIGAGSIVTHDVPRYAVVAGVPARPIRMRFAPDLCTAIEHSRWWTLEPDQIRRIAAEHADALYHPTVARLASAFGGTATLPDPPPRETESASDATDP